MYVWTAHTQKICVLFDSDICVDKQITFVIKNSFVPVKNYLHWFLYAVDKAIHDFITFGLDFRYFQSIFACSDSSECSCKTADCY